MKHLKNKKTPEAETMDIIFPFAPDAFVRTDLSLIISQIFIKSGIPAYI